MLRPLSFISTVQVEIRMLRSGRILGRKATSCAPHRTARLKAPVFQQTTRRPTVGMRDDTYSQLRAYSSSRDSKAPDDAGTVPTLPQSESSRPTLTKVSPVFKDVPTFGQKPMATKPPPFDESTQALINNLYSKLPLDHSKYKTILKVPNDYALLSFKDTHVLAIRCSTVDPKVLTFPLHPTDATRILASGEALERLVQGFRKNQNSRYIFSLEGMDAMRRYFDTDYQPL